MLSDRTGLKSQGPATQALNNGTLPFGSLRVATAKRTSGQGGVLH